MNAVLTNAVSSINDLLWNKWLLLLFLLLGSGIFFSFRTGFVQVRKFKEGLRLVFGNISLRGKKAGKDGMSSFQALATAIAAQVGTGKAFLFHQLSWWLLYAEANKSKGICPCRCL